jgi:hypothetical protein
MQFKSPTPLKLETHGSPAKTNRDIQYEITDLEIPAVPKWNDNLPKPAHMAPRFDYPCPYWHAPVPDRIVELGKIWSIRAGIIYLLSAMFVFISIFLFKLAQMAMSLKW